MNRNKKDQDLSDQAFLSEELEDIYTKSDATHLAGDENAEEQLLSQMGLGGKKKPLGHSENTIAKYLLFALPAVLVILFALFVWPSMYQFSSMKQGSRDYLVKTNRLTGSHAYFYGGKWLDKPLADTPLRLPDPLSITSPNDQPVTANAKSEEQKAPEASASKAQTAAPQPKQPVANALDVPANAPATAKDKKQTVTAATKTVDKEEKTPVAAPAVKAKAETPAEKEEASKPAPQKKAKAAVAKPYAIQIGAFASEDEIKVFLNDQKSRAGIYWVKVRINKKPWYRVFIGQFENQEEAKSFLKKKKIDQRFPGSFVQKTS